MELLNLNQRLDGLRARTLFSILPDDITPEWSEASAALDTALTALLDFDAENDDLLSESWREIAESKERAYVTAIQNGGPVPKRPKGGYAAEAEDKRPAIIGEWFRLKREKDTADSRAWSVLVKTAPLAIPDAHAAIGRAAEAYVEAERALSAARDAWATAINHRVDLEQLSRGTDMHTGCGSGLPLTVIEDVSGKRLSASIATKRAAEWLHDMYGPADAAERLPVERRVRGDNGAVLTMPPHLALMMERSGKIEYVDGFPPESQIRALREKGTARVKDGKVTEAADNA